MANVEAVMQGLLTTVRPIMLEYFHRDSCIAATAICCDVLKAFKIRSMPLSVRAQVFNPILVRLVYEHGHMATTADEMQQWAAQGAWVRLIGYGHEPLAPNKWPGHLVAIAFAKRQPYLIDLSIDQINRSDKQLQVLPFVKAIPETFIASQDPIEFQQARHVLVYEAQPRDISFLASPNWANPQQRDRSVQRIIAAIELQMMKGRA